MEQSCPCRILGHRQIRNQRLTLRFVELFPFRVQNGHNIRMRKVKHTVLCHVSLNISFLGIWANMVKPLGRTGIEGWFFAAFGPHFAADFATSGLQQPLP